MKTRLLLLSMVCSLVNSLYAAPPSVTSVVASQRTGTKLVDVTYNLALDPGQTAFVEFWFSPDNGLTYPVRCMAIAGDANASISAGNAKSAVWNAEEDWDQQFTSSGKIRVIATYGSHPSGFSGSGNVLNPGWGGSSSLIEIPWSGVSIFMAPNWQQEMWILGNGDKVSVDPIETTNAKWNDVADWAASNGYDNLPQSPGGSAPEEPRTGITFWQAIKWCNARSEMEGLDPAYYFNYTEANPQGDSNNNGVVEPGEYTDFNGNGNYDAGHTMVFKNGPAISLDLPINAPGMITPPTFEHCIDYNASGYRLPHEIVFLMIAANQTTQNLWPWGDTAPQSLPNFAAEYAVTLFGSAPPHNPIGTVLTAPSPATRPANAYGVKDIIGNVAEFSEALFAGAPPSSALSTTVFGGSYLGFDSVETSITPVFSIINPASGMSSLFDLVLIGPPDHPAPAIGFRCVTYSKP